MSQENVEIVREHIEAFRHGDPPGALSRLDPYVVWDASRIGLLDIPPWPMATKSSAKRSGTTSERSRITTLWRSG